VTTEVRASIIITARDEATKTLTKVGTSGTSAFKDLNQGAAGVIQKFTGLNIASLGAAAADGESVPGSGNLPKKFVCAENDTDLYGILVTRAGITGEVATHSIYIKLLIRQD